MIARYGPCVGVTLFRLFRWKLELWFAPADYATPEHTHENSDGEFTILWAKNRMIWKRVDGVMKAYRAHVPSCWGKFLTVRAGEVHAFGEGATFMLWLCWQTWKKGVKVTSPAEDFVLTPKLQNSSTR